MDILALTETWVATDETVPVEGYKCTAQFKRQDISAGGVAIHKIKMPPLWQRLIFS
jgi:hypothetical protein